MPAPIEITPPRQSPDNLGIVTKVYPMQAKGFLGQRDEWTSHRIEVKASDARPGIVEVGQYHVRRQDLIDALEATS